MDRTEWMYERKWGVFLHMLHGYMNNAACIRSMGKETTWDECLDDFNCELFAKQISDAGAGWLILTLMQQTRYLLAPNEHYNAATGYKNGEACPKFDFVERMYEALNRYNIKLILYFTGDGPAKDEVSQKEYPFWIETGSSDDRAKFVKNWAEVAREYSIKYGEKVSGWWQDGCWLGYTEDELSYFADAFRAGNSEAVVAQNIYGCLDHYGCLVRQVRKGALNNDYTAGELVDFSDVPYAPSINNARWHILSFLGVPPDKRAYNGWGMPKSKYTPEWMHNYVNEVHGLGGIVTIDICTYRDGHIDIDQLKVLNQIG